MTWTLLTEDWSNAKAMIAGTFPNATDLSAPANLTDLTEFLVHIADGHDLTLSETAEALDELALSMHA